MDVTELYCTIDDFWKSFKQEWEKHLIESGKHKKGPESVLSPAEMMTIVILFHQSNDRTFKHFSNFETQNLKVVVFHSFQNFRSFL
ncbi:hypothetical protein PRO82_001094 [Candidatus Protochlamydia amoebophila]|nr:hypothetical protein [Candidatus Protochlamydia amoebophila]